jgi:hypothetical protein
MMSRRAGVGRTTLLNVPERHLFASRELPDTSQLLTINLLHNTVEGAANDGDIGVVGAEGGLGDR